MSIQQNLSDLPRTISSKLDDLAITNIRQLYARLRADRLSLQNYIGCSDEQFDKFYNDVESRIKEDYPQDMAYGTNHPSVNKSGVAVHRLQDRSRPKYGKKIKADVKSD